MRAFAPRLQQILANFLNARDDGDEPAQVLKSVQPVFVVNDALARISASSVTVNLSSGGNVTVFTVPAGKRWRIRNLTKYATVNAVYVGIVPAQVGARVDFIGGVVAYTIYDPSQPLELHAGDLVVANGGNAVDTAILFNLLYYEDAWTGTGN